MEIIDENGRLFGFINIIDALAILLVIAVVVAGVAVVDPFAQPTPKTTTDEPAIRYATVELSETQPFVAQLITPGDRMERAESPHNVTITDTYLSPGSDDSVTLTLRVALRGTLRTNLQTNTSDFIFDGGRVRLGQRLRLETPDYDVNGTIRRIEATGTTLPTQDSRVVIQTTLPRETAQSIQIGDEYRVSGTSLATIESKYPIPTNDPDQQGLLLGIQYATIERNNDIRFAGIPINLGARLPFRTEDYAIDGRVVQQGETSIQTRKSEVVLKTRVSRETAETISAGDNYEIDGETVGTIESVYEIPTTEPDTKRVLIGVSLLTVVSGSEERFGQSLLTIGASIPFRTGNYELTGQVIERGTTEIRTADIPIVMETELSRNVLDNIEVGDSYRLNDRSVATIDSVTAFPDGSPANRRAIIGMTLEGIDRAGELRFAGRPVKVGTQIPFETADYNLSGRVIRLRDQTLAGEQTQTTAVVKLANVEPEFVDGVEPGMTETRDGTVFARIKDKRTEPASVILTSEDGNIYERQHPRNLDVYLTVELRTRQTTSGLTFHARELQEGTRVTLDLGRITIDGSVITLE